MDKAPKKKVKLRIKSGPNKGKLVSELPKKKAPVKKKIRIKSGPNKGKLVSELPKKKKPAPSLGKKLTGLTKEQMNKLKPEELFGKLPVELRKNVLTSGIKVGRFDLKNLDDEDIIDRVLDNAITNFFDSWSFDGSYDEIKGITKKQAEFYHENTFEGLMEDGKRKAAERYERIGEKILENGLEMVNNDILREYKKWLKANKGKTFKNKKEAIDSFENYYF